jgi:hypothetical protein
VKLRLGSVTHGGPTGLLTCRATAGLIYSTRFGVGGNCGWRKADEGVMKGQSYTWFTFRKPNDGVTLKNLPIILLSPSVIAVQSLKVLDPFVPFRGHPHYPSAPLRLFAISSGQISYFMPQ